MANLDLYQRALMGNISGAMSEFPAHPGSRCDKKLIFRDERESKYGSIGVWERGNYYLQPSSFIHSVRPKNQEVKTIRFQT